LVAEGVSIVGAGALGQAFAAYLARARIPVVLLTRAATYDRLATAGAVRLRGLVDIEVPLVSAQGGASVPPGSVGLTADPALLVPGSGLMFTTKSHQLQVAVDAVRFVEESGLAPFAWVLGVQNGLQKDDVLAAAFGIERLVGAATILSAQRAPDGAVIVTAPGPTYFGELDPAARGHATEAVAFLTRAGVQIHQESDVRVVLWSKACNAAGIFGVCVLARCSGRRMNATAPLVRAFLALVEETANLALAYGVRVEDFPGFPIRSYLERSADATIALFDQQVRAITASGAPENLPSMVQDLLAGRTMEVEGVFGDLLERAARRDVPIPRVEFACEVLRGINAGLIA
jgi:2-dehydropantoate 2-reductase